MSANPSFEKRTGRDRYFAALERELEELIDPATGMLDARSARHVACGVCRSDEPEELFVKRGFTFVRCGSCGHIYCDPQVLPDVVAETYRRSEANEMWTEVLLNAENQAWQMPYFDEAVAAIGRHAPRGRLLDVGCSIGLFMRSAQAAGWDVTGLELGEKAVGHACAAGLDVRREFLEEAGFAPGSFEAITAFGVLEHLNDPGGLISFARPLLAPGGVFMAISPNACSLASMVLHERLPTFDGRNHLQYYTPDSFRLLFERNGYRVLSLDTVLDGLPNVRRHLQYRDPYGEDGARDFLPAKVAALFDDPQASGLAEFMAANDLGLRLRIVATPAEAADTGPSLDSAPEA